MHHQLTTTCYLKIHVKCFSDQLQTIVSKTKTCWKSVGILEGSNHLKSERQPSKLHRLNKSPGKFPLPRILRLMMSLRSHLQNNCICWMLNISQLKLLVIYCQALYDLFRGQHKSQKYAWFEGDGSIFSAIPMHHSNSKSCLMFKNSQLRTFDSNVTL